jgi:DNA invertase Pin-like site-specific DNA recombinase
MNDMVAKGRGVSLEGEQHGCARLADEDVIEIRKRVLEGATQSSIMKEFGISQSNVSFIVNKKRWKHI